MALRPRPTLILGSASPRRRDLLGAIRLAYEVMKPDIDERPRPGERPLDYARRNAQEKAEWVAIQLAANQGAARHPHGAIVISADTIVVLGERILEKPQDVAHAAQMLTDLSGRSHTVITGVTLMGWSASGRAPGGIAKCFAVTTDVTLKELAPLEIRAYVATGEPMDKAGAYAAQGIGSYMIRSIVGSYANVVGLPVAEVVSSLEQDFHYPLWES